MTVEPAMSELRAEQAIDAGAAIVAELAADGCRLVATGDMGIGNTTAAAALTAVLTKRPPAEVTGRGTWNRRRGARAEDRRRRAGARAPSPRRDRPLEALACVGGFEIAGLVGVILGGAAAGLPVLLDGFIAGAAALLAVAIAPAARAYLFAGHRSVEAGHRAVLTALGLEPILDLGLRLGEGTGAVLALPILDAAGRVLDEMASFESAGVSGPADGSR
jgi:nicotinate-nucleotide--dimethylbenzimidazole phosphoribosyltransferase